MLRIEAILMCDLLVISSEGKIQLQGIFDRIWTSELPAQHSKAYVYFRFYPNVKLVNGGKHTVTLAVVQPSGTEETLPSIEARMNEKGKIEGFFELMGLPLQEEGDHLLRLYFDDQEIGFYSFEVRRPRPSKRGKSHDAVH